MKILYLTGALPYCSGEAFLLAEVHELRRRGCELLIVPRLPIEDCVNKDAAALESNSVRKPLCDAEILAAALAVLVRHPIRCVRAIAKMFRSRSLSTLAKNLAVAPKAFWIARLAERWGADHIAAQWASTVGTMGMLAGDITGIPWSCTAHRGDIVGNNLLELKIERASFFRFISEDGVRLAADVCGRPVRGNSFVLHLGVNVPASVAEPPALHVPPILLCPAHLIPRKGQQHLIEAIALLHHRGVNVQAWLAGEGETQEVLQSLAAGLKIEDSVTFLGQVEHDRLLRYYAAGDVDAVVLPTLHEGIPIGLVEAMAYGVPVVATAVGGVPELLRDGAGVLVPPEDPAALADAIERLLGDAELRHRVAATGRGRVEEEFDVVNVVTRLLQQVEGGRNPARTVENSQNGRKSSV